MSFIQLQDISKIYTTRKGQLPALQNIHLNIEKGEIFGIVGPSGAGKSTLLRCINRLEEPSTGRIIIDNEDITQLPLKALNAWRHRIGMIFQHFYLLSSKTVYENVALPLKLLNKDRKEIAHKVQDLLAYVGLLDKQNSYPRALSGGQKQRVAIARALASDSSILLCDEATSALDPVSTEDILQLIKETSVRFNLTVVLITHEMNVIKKICDHVAVIDQGQIIESGPVVQFFKRPQTTLGKSLVHGALNPKLPVALEANVSKTPKANAKPLWRIEFSGEATHTPLVTTLINEFDLEINIYQANVDYIHNEIIGIMLARIDGEEAMIEKSKAYLASKNIIVETLGYVTAHPLTVD